MQLEAGQFLKSTTALNDTLFAGVTIFITEFNADGAVGFVINQPFGRTLNDLVEFKHSFPFPLYRGGPVDQEHLFFVHKRPDLIENSIPIKQDICSGGNFKQAITYINNKTLTTKDIKIFVGYCGWNKGELEAEIEEGSWILSREQINIFS
jgi:putative transcriptional regulator